MKTVKIYKKGSSQEIILPKKYEFDVDELVVYRIGEIVILTPKTNIWSTFMQTIDMFSDDFMQDGRNDSLKQKRE